MHAAIAFLSSVDALVAFQVAGVGEAFAAERTDEGLLTCVDPHVGLQVLQAGQSFTAAVTDKCLPPTVLPAVTGGPVDAIVMSPPVPSDESILPFCHVFPYGELRLICR